MAQPTLTPAGASEQEAKELLTQRYADQIVGTLGCWDRVVITGTLTDVCHAGAVEGWLRRDNIRGFDLKVFAEPLRDQVRDHALLTARAAGLAIEHLERKNFRKEDRVAEILRQRGDAPGLVHVFSAMEACQKGVLVLTTRRPHGPGRFPLRQGYGGTSRLRRGGRNVQPPRRCGAGAFSVTRIFDEL